MEHRERGPAFGILSTLAGIGLIVLLVLMPDLPGPQEAGGSDDVTAFRGRIEELLPPEPGAEPGFSEPRARVLALDGPRQGETLEAYLIGPGGSPIDADYAVGDEVIVTITESPDAGEPFIAVSDPWRIPPLQGLALLFALAVVVVGGWHGVRALVALGLTIAVILKLLLPLVVNGVAPLPLAVVAASAITVVTIGLTEGWKRSSLTAILGTTGSLALTGLLAAVVTGLMGFTYTAGSDLVFLVTESGEGLDLRGLLLAAFILGAVGVLDDVTVTQASVVEELAEKGNLRGRALFASSMAVGRSHIAATVNTLFLAYVGAGLPLLVLLLVSAVPGVLALNNEMIAAEIVRTLVGSIGIVMAVPLTSAFATFLATADIEQREGWGSPGVTPARAVGVAIAIIAALIAATALLPLTGGPRQAAQPPVFEPDGSFPIPTVDPAATDDLAEPYLAVKGEAVPLEIDGAPAGVATVVDWTIGEPAGDFRPVTVAVTYEATAELPLGGGTWEVLLDDGSAIGLEPEGGFEVLQQVLQPGETLELTLSGEIPTGTLSPFVVYLDTTTLQYVFAVALR